MFDTSMVAFTTGWFEIEFQIEIISLAILNKFLTAIFVYFIIVLVWNVYYNYCYYCLMCIQWRTQNFFRWGGSTNSVEDRGQRERGSGGGSPLLRGSGGSCNLVQEISFHTVKFS